MPVTVILAAAAVAAALPVAWLAVSSGRKVTVGVPGGTTDIHQIALSESALGRLVQPVGRVLVRRARGLTPKAWVERLERKIVLAGKAHSWPVERLLAIKFVLALLPTALALLFPPSDQRVWIVVVIGTLVAYVIPDAMLDAAARNRQLVMQRRLPDLLDQLTMSVEAGLGFEAALSRAARSSGGPLAEEFNRTLQEMQLGSPRREALKALAHRVDVTDVRTFVFAVNQAETYGIPIADILRLQASELRTKRHMRAEEAALKIPVKIIFPLAFCVFPTLFIVLLGPAAMRLTEIF
jgi:tight adherence protein C